MTVHFESALEKLKRSLLSLASLTEQQLGNAVLALNNGDRKLADEIIAQDNAIDEMEVDIEEECLKILALFHPVAQDLRLVISVLKINNDLERIGDYAVSIAERAKYLATQPVSQLDIDFLEMERKATWMLRQSLDSLIELNLDKARGVLIVEREMDQIHSDNINRIRVLITERPQHADLILQLLSISRYLERVADMATNIAEDVIYLIEGRIIRHKQY